MAAARPAGWFESKIKAAQSGLDLTRSAIISAILVLLLVYPSAIWWLLDRANLDVKELSIFGAKLERAESSVALASSLGDANQRAEQLARDLESANKVIADLKECFADRVAFEDCVRRNELERSALAEKESKFARAVALAKAGTESAQQILGKYDNLIAQSQVTVSPADTSWGVVFGGDASSREAAWELQKAKKAHATGLGIYHRHGSYRSVAVFPTRDEATRALASLRAIRESAYIVSMSKWCGEARQAESYEGFPSFECA